MINKENKTSEVKPRKNNKICKKNKNVVMIFLIILFAVVTILLFALIFAFNKSRVIDVSKSKIYTLSKKSKEKIKKIDKEIIVKYSKSLDNKILKELAKQIQKENPKIQFVEEKDLGKNNKGLNLDSLIRISAKNETDKSFSYMYSYKDFSILDIVNLKSYSVLEENLVNRLISVAYSDTAEKPSVAFLRKNKNVKNEEVLNNFFAELASRGVKSVILDLKQHKIPESIQVIVVLGATEDLHDLEYEQMKEYQKRGGNFIFAMNPDKGTKTPNFDKLISDYGVSVKKGHVLEHKNSRRYYNKNGINVNNVMYPILSEQSDITKELAMQGKTAMFIFPTKVNIDKKEQLEKKKVNIKVNTMTSAEGMFKEKLADKDEVTLDADPDKKEIISLGVESVKTLNNNIQTKAVVFSDYIFFTDYVIDGIITKPAITEKNNVDLAVNSVMEMHKLKNEFIDQKKELEFNIYLPSDYEKRDKILVYTLLSIEITGIIILWVLNFKPKKEEK